MIQLNKAREILGKTGEDMSDEEIKTLKNNLNSIVSKMLDQHINSQPKCKKQ